MRGRTPHCCLGWLLATVLTGFGAGTRVKDLVTIAGARDNQLVGYGLVSGLVGEGDKNPVYTVQSVANLLQRFGVATGRREFWCRPQWTPDRADLAEFLRVLR